MITVLYISGIVFLVLMCIDLIVLTIMLGIIFRVFGGFWREMSYFVGSLSDMNRKISHFWNKIR